MVEWMKKKRQTEQVTQYTDEMCLFYLFFTYFLPHFVFYVEVFPHIGMVLGLNYWLIFVFYLQGLVIHHLFILENVVIVCESSSGEGTVPILDVTFDSSKWKTIFSLQLLCCLTVWVGWIRNLFLIVSLNETFKCIHYALVNKGDGVKGCGKLMDIVKIHVFWTEKQHDEPCVQCVVA